MAERSTAAAVFAYALALYVLTVAPATSFWDSGEFIAIANRLQVSHPPGAPFYMLIGRLFSMFVPVAYIALAVNMVSVVASALTILMTHLIIVRLVREWQGQPGEWTGTDRVTALAGGVIGACTFAATDSFWFNAVEAEVYALSMLFTTAVVWLILKWREQATIEEAALKGGQHPFGLAANRYLVLIAYMFGIAIGVHLLNLLAIFFIALIFFYTEYEKADWTTGDRIIGLVVTGAVSSAAFLFVYPGVVQVLPGIVGDSGSPVFVTVMFLSVVIGAVAYTHTRRMQALNLIALCVAVVLIGYSTYSLIFIRSASNPPIDENDPETVDAIVSYLKREQYGETPILKGSTYDNRISQIDQRREVWFPRRYSPDPNHMRVYAQYESDGQFFWQYQVGHMYLRYFLWNYVGRASDVQDAPAITGFSDVETARYLYQTPSEEASRNAYYGLPLLLGLIGASFHFLRDWRRAMAVGVLFTVTGVGIILYLNQTPMQPRERDYAYVASFFAFSLWVGIGASGVIQLIGDALGARLSDERRSRMLALAVAGILLVAVPLHMMVENFFDHDRSGRYAAGDYAYNMLQSVDENAVLLTNGDNDTFPLWYAQEVEGVRQDVRVANLSLMNTSWYVRQLKNQSSRDSAPLPISLPDDQIDDLTIVPWRPEIVPIPVNKEKLFGSETSGLMADDSSLVQSPMSWMLNGRPYPLDPEINLLYGVDQVALNMVLTNAQQDWKRPLYFAVTVSPDGQLDLQNYFQLEGQAYRIVPIEHQEQLGRVVPGLTDERLKKFRFQGLNDPDVYFDENIRRMVDNYRNVFSHTAASMSRSGHTEDAKALLDNFMEAVPFETIPGDERSYLFMSEAYRAVGDFEQSLALMKLAEPIVLHRLEFAGSDRDIQLAARFIELIRLAYLDSGDYQAAADFSTRIADLIGDPSYGQTAEELEAMYREGLGAFEDTLGSGQ
jgi:Protein O-mannosyl-transferase TMEM260-like